MRPIVTDAPVGLSQSWALQKQLNWSRCHIACGLRWAHGPKKTCITWGPDPHVNRQLCGGRGAGDVISTANGRLKQQDQQFIYSGIRASHKHPAKCSSVAGNCDESDKIQYT